MQPVLVCSRDRELRPSRCPLRPNPWYVWGTVSMKDDHSSSGKLGLSKITSKPNLTTSSISVTVTLISGYSARAVRHAAPSSLRRFSAHCRRSFKASPEQTQPLQHMQHGGMGYVQHANGPPVFANMQLQASSAQSRPDTPSCFACQQKRLSCPCGICTEHHNAPFRGAKAPQRCKLISMDHDELLSGNPGSQTSSRHGPTSEVPRPLFA